MIRSLRLVACAAMLATPLGVVTAATAPALQGGVVSGTVSTTYQTNDTVWKLAYGGGAIYALGEFTAVRPSGAAAGTSETARQYLAAFNSSTGALLPFNHTFNVRPTSVATSPDGSRVYVGGSFTQVDGRTVNRLAAFNTSTGALITTFNPAPSGGVTAIAATNSTVYFSGNFAKVGTANRAKLAAVTSAGALVAGWAPSSDASANTLSVTTDGAKVYAGGGFNLINGDAHRAVAALDGGTGTALSFPADSAMPPVTGNCTSVVKDSTIVGGNVYFAAEGTGGGCFDGTFSAQVSDGSLRWKNTCLGATQSIAVVGDVVYKGSHAHDCASQNSYGDPDAFTQVPDGGNSRHLLGQRTDNGFLAPWYPQTNGGPGGGLGPRAMASDGTNLWVGGEFTVVNNKAQQGLARFGPSPDTAPKPPAKPYVVSGGGTSANVYVQVPLDLDDTDLIVRIYRDGGTTPVATSTVQHSLFWKQPVIGLKDTGLATGSKHTYKADAIEANGTVASTMSTVSNQVTVGTADSPYATAVQTDGPSLFWRLGEPSGVVAADSSTNLAAGVYVPGDGTITYGTAGGPAGDPNTAVTLADGAHVTAGQYAPSPSAYSVEAWFKTTSTTGGKIIGFGNAQYDDSTNYDKHVYMTNSGQLIFGVYTGGFTRLQSSASYNDGTWHHVVGTQGATGMRLYVDGVKIGSNTVSSNQVYDGYWRVGEDNLNGWPSQPSSSAFNGTIDDVAVYPGALSQNQVITHYNAGGGSVPIYTGPSDTYGHAVYAAGPDSYWRLGESTGSVAADATGNGITAAYGTGVTLGASGAVPGTTDTAVTLDGTGNGLVESADAIASPSTFSTELWFKTTTTSGGKIIGFGDNPNGNSGSYDKHVYMTDDGHLVFGVWIGNTQTVTTPGTYNDGAWHQLVATQGASGMVLYVDGSPVGTNPTTTNQSYNGYWKIGGDNINGWPGQPSSSSFAGSVDEVAIYPTALSAADVAAHWAAAGH
jgi:large repetitive protein